MNESNEAWQRASQNFLCTVCLLLNSLWQPCCAHESSCLTPAMSFCSWLPYCSAHGSRDDRAVIPTAASCAFVCCTANSPALPLTESLLGVMLTGLKNNSNDRWTPQSNCWAASQAGKICGVEPICWFQTPLAYILYRTYKGKAFS